MSLFRKKINNPYIPITETLTEISKIAETLNDVLEKLENERIDHNEKATKTEPIISCLLSLNDQIAYYDVIESFKQYDLQVAEMATVKKAYDDAVADQNAKKVKLEDLNGRRKRIDIAIDIINSSFPVFLNCSRESREVPEFIVPTLIEKNTNFFG